MDGNLFGYQIPPDSFQAINPIMILLFIPLFDFFLYPLLSKFQIAIHHCTTISQVIFSLEVLTSGIQSNFSQVIFHE